MIPLERVLYPLLAQPNQYSIVYTSEGQKNPPLPPHRKNYRHVGIAVMTIIKHPPTILLAVVVGAVIVLFLLQRHFAQKIIGRITWELIEIGQPLVIREVWDIQGIKHLNEGPGITLR